MCRQQSSNSRPATTPLADLLAGRERRQQVIKNAFRRDIGYVDPAEVRRIAEQGDVEGEVVDGVVDALNEAKRQSPG